jgi:hypothetical protein
MRLRKSNSAPSLLSLAEGAEDDGDDASSQCSASEAILDREARDGAAESGLHWHQQQKTRAVPLYQTTLKHVDSMELMTRYADEHTNEVIHPSDRLVRVGRALREVLTGCALGSARPCGRA